MNESVEGVEEEVEDIDLLEDTRWGVVGAHSIVYDAEEILKLENDDIARVYRYDQFFDEVLNNPDYLEQLRRQQSL